MSYPVCPDCGAVEWGNASCLTCRSHWHGGDPLLAGPSNELELELQLKRVTLRDFDYQLRPLAADAGVNGLELEATARDTGLRISLLFDRGEFVNIATGGLAMLDQADAATENTEGR